MMEKIEGTGTVGTVWFHTESGHWELFLNSRETNLSTTSLDLHPSDTLWYLHNSSYNSHRSSMYFVLESLLT